MMGLWAEFRAGDPDALDTITTAGGPDGPEERTRSYRTAAGIGVGSTARELTAAYGNEPEFCKEGEGGNYANFALF